MEKLLLPQETAEILGVAAKTLAMMRWRGDGPKFCKIGGQVRYRMQDLQEFIEANLHRSTSDIGVTDFSC